MPIKFLVLGGGGLGFFGRGGGVGSATFIFMGVGIFPIFRDSQQVRGGEPEGVRKHLLSKKVFSVLRRFLEGKKGF